MLQHFRMSFAHQFQHGIGYYKTYRCLMLDEYFEYIIYNLTIFKQFYKMPVCGKKICWRIFYDARSGERTDIPEKQIRNRA
jgi:hypothetical protein